MYDFYSISLRLVGCASCDSISRLLSGAAMGWTGWAMSSGSVWCSNGVDRVGNVQRDPECMSSRLPGQTTENNFPVTVGETFNRFADFGL